MASKSWIKAGLLNFGSLCQELAADEWITGVDARPNVSLTRTEPRSRLRQTVFCTFTRNTWQFIIFTIFTITACIFSYSLSISFWTQDLALQQILSSIDLFLSYVLRTDSTDSRTIQWFYSAQWLDLFASCVRLTRLVVGFRTQFKSLHFHSFIHEQGYDVSDTF